MLAVLLPVLGLGVSLTLQLRTNLRDLWIVWTPFHAPFIIFYPLFGYFSWKRRRQLTKALVDWNR